MKFDSEAAFHYLLYHDILQWQKDNRDKKDEAPRWYHLQVSVGPIALLAWGVAAGKSDVWNVYDSGPPDHSFPAEDQEPSCCMLDNEITWSVQKSDDGSMKGFVDWWALMLKGFVPKRSFIGWEVRAQYSFSQGLLNVRMSMSDSGCDEHQQGKTNTLCWSHLNAWIDCLPWVWLLWLWPALQCACSAKIAKCFVLIAQQWMRCPTVLVTEGSLKVESMLRSCSSLKYGPGLRDWQVARVQTPSFKSTTKRRVQSVGICSERIAFAVWGSATIVLVFESKSI